MSLQPRLVNFDEYWKDLSVTLRAVITCGKVERRVWNDRFSDVYALCVAYPEPLYKELYHEVRMYLESHVKEIYRDITSSGDEWLMSKYYTYWQQYSKGCEYINALFSYLNQQFIKKQRKTGSDYAYGDIHPVDPKNQFMEIGELAYDAWKRLLIIPIEKSLVDTVLDEIHRDRTQSSTVNQGVVHAVINSLVAVDERSTSKSELLLYKSVFEDRFLKTTGEYYRQKASEYISELTCCEYLEKAIQLLTDEERRCRRYLHPSSYKLVKMQLEERFSSDHLSMLHAECHELVQRESSKDLANMYKLLMPIKGTSPLCQSLEAHIKKTGLQMIESFTTENVHQQFVEAMLTLHRKYSQMVHETFINDQQFIAVLDKACSAVINHKPPGSKHCRSPELLVKYCDSLLRKGVKALSEMEIDERLNASITVFKYLADKDIYQGVYQRMLCKRLIYRLSASMDAEEVMINRLKQTCGYEFTNKLHRMFTDMNISADLGGKFLERCKEDMASLTHGFSILVLQAGSWPISSQKIPQFQLPSELERSVQLFEKFYETKFNGRKLSWVHGYSTGELKLQYLPKAYSVTLGLYQMSILLQYNDCLQYTADELKERTKLEEKDWNRHVQPLTNDKMIILVDGYYALNMYYTNKRTKFKIMSVAVKETQQETERVRTSTDEDRKWQIQAAIVRIMKSRKLFRHNLLIEEVIKQLSSRFNPSVSLIKKSIEALIEKQYMERTPDSKDEYSYIA
ncbi:cullin-2-like [Watersipora subatra]|uniref:cullin-2-like n=1 Tax=Watersipora subatra TaxID=2589382 RepID=UPI00355AD660